ncbi:Protein CBG06755 [Caenorhabditis briggsae]|uniref:Uncharacterized protein n=2 Tax=Caenorhabditis briggsae TaxID=6238 RepID=A0AAE8ZYY7_CAEBR|nr:Protein CBG06755 [Caenorhabditis briggsae]ULT88351.1 hypothetical protein L3Y34_007504 [Caenorhabditis briggsae]CAP27014.2 Protein CBG06755 [Caenorhabditis briggsae]
MNPFEPWFCQIPKAERDEIHRKVYMRVRHRLGSSTLLRGCDKERFRFLQTHLLVTISGMFSYNGRHVYFGDIFKKMLQNAVAPKNPPVSENRIDAIVGQGEWMKYKLIDLAFVKKLFDESRKSVVSICRTDVDDEKFLATLSALAQACDLTLRTREEQSAWVTVFGQVCYGLFLEAYDKLTQLPSIAETVDNVARNLAIENNLSAGLKIPRVPKYVHDYLNQFLSERKGNIMDFDKKFLSDLFRGVTSKHSIYNHLKRQGMKQESWVNIDPESAVEE